MKSFKVWSGIAVLTSGIALSACSAHKEVPPPPPPTVSVSESKTPQGGEIQQTITATAAVQKIDQKTRMVTLKGPDGKTKTIHVSDQVQNLAQVKKGDLVTIAYYESIAYELKKKGTAEPSVNAAADAARAPVGSMPGAVGGAAVSVTAKITKIDKKTDTVTLKGPKGKTVEVKVKDPSRLENVKVGDLVEITYTEAMAISVEKAAKK
jgi:Cu/Ag efflux protein CusF